MKKGFTLAEVLITLGIIGVVAAMTIPTLIQNTNSVKFASQFKKSISTLSQAALMSQAQYDIDYSLANMGSDGTVDEGTSLPTGWQNDCGKQTVSTGMNSFCGIFNNTLAGQTYYGAYGSDDVKAANGTGKYEITTRVSMPDPNGWYVYSLADGSYVGFNPKARNCGLGAGNVLDADVLQQDSSASANDGGGLKNCLGFIDVNGPTAPNREVSCNTASQTKLDPSESCDVARTGAQMGDVFPVVFHDGVVEPASNAAKMVLSRGK